MCHLLLEEVSFILWDSTLDTRKKRLTTFDGVVHHHFETAKIKRTKEDDSDSEMKRNSHKKGMRMVNQSMDQFVLSIMIMRTPWKEHWLNKSI